MKRLLLIGALTLLLASCYDPFTPPDPGTQKSVGDSIQCMFDPNCAK